MGIVELINKEKKIVFFFEVFLLLKGIGIEKLYVIIDILWEFDFFYVNIIIYCSEYVYCELGGGLYECNCYWWCLGMVVVVVVIYNKYDIIVVLYILCSGFLCEDMEYILFDL